MIFAKYQTAITIPFGPVLDSDGAEYTGVAVGDVKISKNSGTPAALDGSATLTHKEVGIYELALTTSDISTIGQETVTLSKTTYVAAPVHIIVLPAKVYDSLIGGTDNLETDTIQWLGTDCSTPNVAGIPKVDVARANGVDQSVVLLTGVVDGVTFTPTTTEFETASITTAAADHYNGRVIIFTSGTLSGQATLITDYSKVGSNGRFVVNALTSAPEDQGTFVIY